MNDETWRGWIDQDEALAIARQCERARGVRATVYGRPTAREESEEDLVLCGLIDEEYTRRPADRCVSGVPNEPDAFWPSGLEHGQYLHPAGARLRGFAGDHRLVLAAGAVMANLQERGHAVLHRLF